ncbi:MAG: branched-chain amino acid ABC transporter permease [Pseudomonadota bacterium]
MNTTDTAQCGPFALLREPAYRNITMFSIMASLFVLVGLVQGWGLSLTILNLCLISAIMSLGVNIQWGYAGLLNVGVMGFVALGGLAAVLVSVPPVEEAIAAGGAGLLSSLVILLVTVALVIVANRKVARPYRVPLIASVIIIGYFVGRSFYAPAIEAIEAVNPALEGNLGGLGLPILSSWIVGGLFAAGAACVVGKISLGLRSDYLAIATLGISEIIITILKHEEWLARGVKNQIGLPRPVPYEVAVQNSLAYQSIADRLGMDIVDFSSIFVKLCYAGLFLAVLVIILYFAEKALKSPWGRMMQAIRDNETAAAAMGKDVKGRHLQVFILGSAVIGIAGAMLTTIDGQFTPPSYHPLRYTFLIWVMVIVGGSGNNWGAVLGGFVIWFFWVQAEPIGLSIIEVVTSGLAEDSAIREHLVENAAHMRSFTMGLILLLVLRFSPRGLLPEQ